MKAAREFIESLKAEWDEVIKTGGGCCPVCDRWGKQYKRPINKTMLASLKWLYDVGGANNWVDVPNVAPQWVVRTNQLSTLQWWGLIDCKRNINPKKKTSGIWRITEKGKNFVENKIELNRSVITYNNTVIDYVDDLVKFKDMYDSFDYSELMEQDTVSGKK